MSFDIEEKNILSGILITEIMELEDLIKISNGSDKMELEKNLMTVKRILDKLA